MEMGMDGLLPLQSAGDVRCLLKERHRGTVGGWRCASVVLVQQTDLANLVLKERWPLSAHRRNNRVRNGSTSDKTHIERNESVVTLIADMLTTKVALLRISNCRSGFLPR
jgi:hypothetical protein